MTQQVLGSLQTGVILTALAFSTPAWVASQSPLADADGPRASMVAATGAFALAASGSIVGVAGFVGSVGYSGPAVDNEVVDMTSDRYCSGIHDGGTVVRWPVAVDAASRVRDVVVFVREGLEGTNRAVPDDDVVLDQDGCLYAPKALAMMAGQTLTVRNSDATLHNVHAFPEINQGFNIGQPIRGLESRRTFDDPEVGIEVKCDVHGWMSTSISVFDHPFFAVTDEDGAFSIDGLPPGDYVIEAWHRTLGTRTQAVTVEEGTASDVTILYEG